MTTDKRDRLLSVMAFLSICAISLLVLGAIHRTTDLGHQITSTQSDITKLETNIGILQADNKVRTGLLDEMAREQDEGNGLSGNLLSAWAALVSRSFDFEGAGVDQQMMGGGIEVTPSGFSFTANGDVPVTVIVGHHVHTNDGTDDYLTTYVVYIGNEMVRVQNVEGNATKSDGTVLSPEDAAQYIALAQKAVKDLVTRK